MLAQLTSEVHKSLTSRSWRLLMAGSVLVAAVITAGLAMIGATVSRSPIDLGTAEHLRGLVGIPTTLTFAVTAVIGVLVYTTERQNRTLTQTLLATPQRSRVFAGKALWSLLTGLALGVLNAAACGAALAGVLALTGRQVDGLLGIVAPTLVGVVLVTAAWLVIGLGVGVLVKDQLIAIVSILVLTQVVEPMVRMVGGPTLPAYLPGALTDAATGGGLLAAATGVAHLAGPTALGVLAALTAAVLGAGVLRFRRHQEI